MQRQISLLDYLGKSQLTDHLSLSRTHSFHWSNWDKTCFIQKDHYQKFNNNLHLTSLNNSLLELKKIPVWLCNKVQVKLIDLYALYESYLDSRLRLTWFDRKSEILFSMGNEQGPYYTITSMKWFNKEIYAQFVMRKILLEQFTLRSFRLNTEIPVNIKFDNDVKDHQNIVTIHQLTEVGIILKIANKNFLNKIKNSSMLDCNILLGNFEAVQGLNFHDTWKKLDEEILYPNERFKTYKLESRILNFYANNLNAQRSGDSEFYIFARYEDLRPNTNEKELYNIFAPVVDKTKKYFLKDLQDLDLQRKAA